MKLSFVKAHRILASLLLIFIISHLLIHLTAINGAETHIKALAIVRPIYLNMIVEPLLILSIMMQVIIGYKLLRRRWQQEYKTWWGWMQIISGAYLGLFLIMHTSAALITRYGVGLDTNFYWAAGTLNIGILPYWFAPYYFLAILSLFSHLAAAIHFGWGDKAKFIAPMIIIIGVMIGILIIAAFSGGFYDIQMPHEYRDYFEMLNNG